MAKSNLVIGIILVVLGALILLGRFTLGEFVPFLGIALIIAGILILLHVLAGGFIIGVAVLVLGILLQGRWLQIKNAGPIWDIIDLVVGIVLVVMGVLKIIGR